MIFEDWDRLEQLIKWTGVSVNAFALHIGLKRSENLYQIKRGNHGISKDLVEIITAKYPEISKMWLLVGEGEMFLPGGANSAREFKDLGVPFYNIDVALLGELGALPKVPVYYIQVPIFAGCDFAALCTGTAMAPEITAGSIIILKEVPIGGALPGETYLVVSANFSGVRILRTHPTKLDAYRLVPRNLEDYDEIILPQSSIKRLFLVKGVIVSKIL